MPFPGDIEVHSVDPRAIAVLHRLVTIEDTSPDTLSLTAAGLYVYADNATVDTPYDPHGAKTVEMRIYHGAAAAQALDNTTSTWTLVGVPHGAGSPKARKLLSFVATSSSDTSALDPITGAATAEAYIYSEPDTFATIKEWTRYKVLDGTGEEVGAEDSAAVIQFDPCGMKVFAFCTAVSAEFAGLTTPTIKATLRNVG